MKQDVTYKVTFNYLKGDTGILSHAYYLCLCPDGEMPNVKQCMDYLETYHDLPEVAILSVTEIADEDIPALADNQIGKATDDS